jgi:hypothetical protein
MKRLLTLALLFFIVPAFAQQIGSVTVNGDFDKYYPVLFSDGAWGSNVATELELGRSDVHENSQWRAALMLKLRFHTTNWGHGANFIDASIYYDGTTTVAGWRDATTQNGSVTLVIWLRGGGTTYHYKSSNPTIAVVHDGVQNPLPYQEENGPALYPKTQLDSYVNSRGVAISGNGSFYGGGQNYFAGNVAIGTPNTEAFKLAVNGSVRAKSITVDNGVWPDYVFEPTYPIRSLNDLESYINKNKHLPEIPSADEVRNKGVELSDINAKLLKKIEELTLYMIQMNKELEELKSKDRNRQDK